MNLPNQFFIGKANTVYNNSFTTSSYLPFALQNELDLNGYSIASRKNTRNKIKGRSNTCQGFENKGRNNGGQGMYNMLKGKGEISSATGNYSTLGFNEYSNRWASPHKKIKLRNFASSKHQKGPFNLTRVINVHCKIPQNHTAHPRDNNNFFTNSDRNTKQPTLSDELILHDKMEQCKLEEQSMLNELEKISNNRFTLNDEDFVREKEGLLMKYLKTIINIDPFFSKILEEVKDYLWKLMKEVIELRKNNENQKEVIELQKIQINELKANIDTLNKENNARKLSIIDKEKKLKAIDKELKDKNKELGKALKEMNAFVKNNKLDLKIIELPGSNSKKSLNKSVIEVGRKRVKIPMLKLYKLPKTKPSKLVVKGKSNNKRSESHSPNSEEAILVTSDIDGNS